MENEEVYDDEQELVIKLAVDNDMYDRIKNSENIVCEVSNNDTGEFFELDIDDSIEQNSNNDIDVLNTRKLIKTATGTKLLEIIGNIDCNKITDVEELTEIIRTLSDTFMMM